jgi:hypothetical protein
MSEPSKSPAIKTIKAQKTLSLIAHRNVKATADAAPSSEAEGFFLCTLASGVSKTNRCVGSSFSQRYLNQHNLCNTTGTQSHRSIPKLTQGTACPRPALTASVTEIFPKHHFAFGVQETTLDRSSKINMITNRSSIEC